EVDGRPGVYWPGRDTYAIVAVLTPGARLHTAVRTFSPSQAGYVRKVRTGRPRPGGVELSGGCGHPHGRPHHTGDVSAARIHAPRAAGHIAAAVSDRRAMAWLWR